MLAPPYTQQGWLENIGVKLCMLGLCPAATRQHSFRPRRRRLHQKLAGRGSVAVHTSGLGFVHASALGSGTSGNSRFLV